MIKKQMKYGLLASSLLASTVASAEFRMNLTKGVTELSETAYSLHMLAFWICVVVSIFVFGGMIYSIIAHRKSKGVEPAKFSHSTTVEIIWTVIPILILIAIALPATKGVMRMENPTHLDGQVAEMEMTIKITGHQWKWRYDYLDEGFGFYSTLAADSNIARQKGSGIDVNTVDNYLLEVDKPLVLPVNTNVRFLLTSDDVIHSWWVPDFGWKRDAIPGFINEAWANVNTVGTYRGQCAELCGKDHGYMPVVVEVVSKADYATWLTSENGNGQVAAVTSQSDESESNDSTTTSSTATESSEADQDQVASSESADNETSENTEQDDTDTTANEASEDVTEVVDANEADAEAGWSMDKLMTHGENVYNTQCLACHKIDGTGMPPAFPALAGSQVVIGDIAKQIDTVVNGVAGTAMAPFGRMLPAEDIAAVITYTRNSLGNDIGDRVQPSDIEAAKQ